MFSKSYSIGILVFPSFQFNYVREQTHQIESLLSSINGEL